MYKPFSFKQFSVADNRCAHKVGTDGVLIGAWASPNKPTSILDVGSGSGLVSLMLAQRFPHAKITGIELDKSAVMQARENVKQSPFAKQINLIHSDFTTHAFVKKYDAIVSNPPFFKGTTKSGDALRDLARADDLLPLEVLALRVSQLLTENGTFWVILPKEEAQHFISVANEQQLVLNKRCKVFGAPNKEDKRWLLCFSFEAVKSVLEETLCLRDSENQRSKEYVKLARDFYL